MTFQIESTQPGKRSGDNAADGQSRKVGQHGRELGDGNGGSDLSQIVEQGAEYADKNHILIS